MESLILKTMWTTAWHTDLMRKIPIVCMVILLTAVGAGAQSYRPVDSLSSVKVVIKNVGMETEGLLSGIDGAIVFNPGDLKTALFSVTIYAASINTGIEPRDVALKEAEYLNTEKYPKIGFESRAVTKSAGEGRYLIKGIISMKGIAKEVSFPFTVIPKGNGLLFTGEMKLYRRDFKIGMNSTVLSDQFSVVLSVFAKKAA